MTINYRKHNAQRTVSFNTEKGPDSLPIQFWIKSELYGNTEPTLKLESRDGKFSVAGESVEECYSDMRTLLTEYGYTEINFLQA